MKRSFRTSTWLKKGVESVVIHCDSQVVVGHINGNYEVKGNG